MSWGEIAWLLLTWLRAWSKWLYALALRWRKAFVDHVQADAVLEKRLVNNFHLNVYVTIEADEAVCNLKQRVRALRSDFGVYQLRQYVFLAGDKSRHNLSFHTQSTSSRWRIWKLTGDLLFLRVAFVTTLLDRVGWYNRQCKRDTFHWRNVRII